MWHTEDRDCFVARKLNIFDVTILVNLFKFWPCLTRWRHTANRLRWRPTFWVLQLYVPSEFSTFHINKTLCVQKNVWKNRFISASWVNRLLATIPLEWIHFSRKVFWAAGVTRPAREYKTKYGNTTLKCHDYTFCTYGTLFNLYNRIDHSFM